MSLYDNIFSILILIVIALLIYAKASDKSLTDIWNELLGVFKYGR